MLDPIGFGGGNTNYQAFAFGLPVVTIPGEFMRGRIADGFYQKMGMLNCVATTPKEYVEIAVKLGTDPDYRQTIKDKILTQNHVLYEDKQAIEELEAFFIEAVENARAKENTDASLNETHETPDAFHSLAQTTSP